MRVFLQVYFIRSEVVWIEMPQLPHSTEDSLVWLKSLENIIITANGSKLE